MRGRILFVAGIAAGYVVGARAGRPAYDAVVDRVQSIAGNEKVQQVGGRARKALEERAPRLADVAEKTVSTVTGATAAAQKAGTDAVGEEPAGSAA